MGHHTVSDKKTELVLRGPSAARPIEGTQNASSEQRNTSQENAIHQGSIQEMNARIGEMTQRCERRDKHIEALRNQVQVERQEKPAVQRDLERSKAETVQLMKNFGECKENLFKLQSTVCLSDTQIAQCYDLLCEDIADWVDTELPEIENLLIKLLQSSRELDAGYNHLNAYCQSGLIEVMERFPSAYVIIVRCLIERHLEMYIFNTDNYFLGVPDKYDAFLKMIEDGMMSLGPQKG